MALVINDSPVNPFLFSFIEPVGNPGPDPQNFTASTTFTYADTVPASINLDFDLDPVTSNMGNTDRFGNNPASVSFGPGNTITPNGTTGGTVAVDIDVPFAMYNRVGAGEVLTMEWVLLVTAEGGQSDSTTVRIAITGRNDLPTAFNDAITVNDTIGSFTNGGVLANDDDVDIKDVFSVTAVGAATVAVAGPGTVLPAEYVAQTPGTATFTASSIKVNFNKYYQFLAPGESVTFNVQYTMSDGHGGFDTANVLCKINGTATMNFAGTNASEQMLGENDKDKMFGANGNDTIFARGGNDIVDGDKGNDIVVGGLGADDLFGDKGNDIFRLMSALESPKKGSLRDVFMDFKRGSDTADLSAIDAIAGGADDPFKWIGKKGFKGNAGELRYDTKGTKSIALGDITGDGKADFSLQFNGVSKLGKGDFDL